MSWRYFFNQNAVFHGNFKVSAYEGNKNTDETKRVIEVVHGKQLLEAVRQLFQISFSDIFKLCKTSDTFINLVTFLYQHASDKCLVCKIMFQPVYYTSKAFYTSRYGHIALIVIDNTDMNIWEAKDAITDILDGGAIPAIFGATRYSLMFDYEPVDIDSIASCFTAIHRRNEELDIIPLYSYHSSQQWIDMSAAEKDSIACHLTKLLIFSSRILVRYYGSKMYMNMVEMRYNQEFMLIEEVERQSADLTYRLQNKAVHKMKNEIRDFMDILAQLEKLIRRKEVRTDIKNDQHKQCVRSLGMIFYLDSIPRSDAWIPIKESFILAEECKYWKKRVIWPLGEELLSCYYHGELSEYSWVQDSKNKETEPRLIINGEKYYFGIAIVEEEGWREKISPEQIKKILKHKFEDTVKLFQSISCRCSPTKSRLWLCERCLWLMRDFGSTGIFCRCRQSALEELKVCCGKCKIDEFKLLIKVKDKKEMEVGEQWQVLGNIKPNIDGNQIHNRKVETNPANIIEREKKKQENITDVPPAIVPPVRTSSLSSSHKNELQSTVTSMVFEINEVNEKKTGKSLTRDEFCPQQHAEEHESQNENNIQDFNKINVEPEVAQRTSGSESNRSQEGYKTKTPPPPPPIENYISPNFKIQKSTQPSSEIKSFTDDLKNTVDRRRQSGPTESNAYKRENSTSDYNAGTPNSRQSRSPLTINFEYEKQIQSSPLSQVFTPASPISDQPHQMMKLKPSPEPYSPAETEEWDKSLTKYKEHQTPPFKADFPEVTAEWDNIITEYKEHQKIPLLIVPPPPVVTAEWDNIITVYTEHETIPFTVVHPLSSELTEEFNKNTSFHKQNKDNPFSVLTNALDHSENTEFLIRSESNSDIIPAENVDNRHTPMQFNDIENDQSNYISNHERERVVSPHISQPPTPTINRETSLLDPDLSQSLSVRKPTISEDTTDSIMPFEPILFHSFVLPPSPPLYSPPPPPLPSPPLPPPPSSLPPPSLPPSSLPPLSSPPPPPPSSPPPLPPLPLPPPPLPPPPLPPLPQEFTVIFLGESGVGKSTLISGLGNYLNWPTFEEAKKNQMEICIPVEFKVQRKLEEGGFDETTVRAGDFEDNENFNDVGQSITQKPKVHESTFQNNTVKVIDTPGLSDTRGAEQDKKNLELIRECIHNQKEIHAICIVLKSNESKLGNQFELAIRDLLSLFPKSALKNVFFFFTYARGTYFGIGDILNPLKELQQKFRDSHGVTFEFEGKNMCPVDSESFRYLLCKEQGIKYSSSAEERFEYCWNETAKQVLDFLAFLKGVDPVDVEKIKAAHEIVKTALELEEFLRTDKTLKKGLSEEARESLNEKAKPLFFIAKDLTMVSEYYRLKTNLIRFDSAEAIKAVSELLSVVKNSSIYDGLSEFMNNLSLLERNYDRIA